MVCYTQCSSSVQYWKWYALWAGFMACDVLNYDEFVLVRERFLWQIDKKNIAIIPFIANYYYYWWLHREFKCPENLIMRNPIDENLISLSIILLECYQRLLSSIYQIFDFNKKITSSIRLVFISIEEFYAFHGRNLHLAVLNTFDWYWFGSKVWNGV